jgi:hypothetical protein
MIIVSPQQKRLLIASAIVWGLAFLIALYKANFRSANSMVVSIVTVPKSVKIKVNGRFLQNGRYLSTPYMVPLKAGKNEIRISREGYRPHVTTVEKTEEEKLTLGEIALVKKSDFETVSIEVFGDKITNPYYIDINKGFLQGETPLLGSDLPLKATHILEIYPEGSLSGTRVKCTLTPGEQGSSHPSPSEKIRVKIARKPDGSLQASGCQILNESLSDDKGSPPTDAKK